jgi:hypothetical protein
MRNKLIQAASASSIIGMARAIGSHQSGLADRITGKIVQAV